MDRSVLIRVESSDFGTKRVEAPINDTVRSFLARVKIAFDLREGSFQLYSDRARKTQPIIDSVTKSIASLGIKHGDRVFLAVESSVPSTSTDKITQKSLSGAPTLDSLSTSQTKLAEDEVDRLLDSEDGLIRRQQNPQLCQHNAGSQCIHCAPLKPFDDEFINSLDPPLKFLSFHSYIRKITSNNPRGKFVTLDNITCRIRPGCTDHPPWPHGICTKCQPSAITLSRQKYRHVDYISIENPQVVEPFLNYWRQTGSQRIGIMFGRYEVHKDLPLAIKATVAGIYEPPQRSARSSVQLLPDPNEAAVAAAFSHLGLRPVGWIFTDLVPNDLGGGPVRHFRGSIDSHFLSAEECIMAAHFQNRFPNPCRLAADARFGSKFVTVVVTGDKDNNIHFEGYQVSNQCMALVRDDCLLPTLDAPELGYVKESTNEQYVPDVFYAYRDKYGNDVKSLARPLPVEYLLVDMAVGFPKEPQHTLASDALVNLQHRFPVANREELGELPSLMQLHSYLNQFADDDFMTAVSNFHLIVFLATCDALPVKSVLPQLLEAVHARDGAACERWRHTDEWETVAQMRQLISESPRAPLAPRPPAGPAPARHARGSAPAAAPPAPSEIQFDAATLSAFGSESWNCPDCTFINAPDAPFCEMCHCPNPLFA